MCNCCNGHVTLSKKRNSRKHFAAWHSGYSILVSVIRAYGFLWLIQGALTLEIVGSECLYGTEWVLDASWAKFYTDKSLQYTVYLLGLTHTGTSHLHTSKSSVLLNFVC